MIHPAVEKLIDAFATALPHAILVTGREGVGLRSVVERLAARRALPIEWVLPEKKEVIDREAGTVSVDIIRRLYDQTKTRAATSRVIVIDRADTMTLQAQNAFLKLLEEPNPSIHFILLAHDSGLLLPTIRSRTQALRVRPISRQQSEQYLDTLGISNATKRAQLLFLAEGLPETLERLATDAGYLEQRSKLIKDAQVLIQPAKYEALKVTHRYKDDRASALAVLSAAMRLLEVTMKRQPHDRYITQLEQFLKAHEAIAQNGNIRLHLVASVL
jgi:DNA polymerase III delta prime subunit